jgi:hypothetical protein
MVVAVHLAFVAFFLAGGFLAWRAPRVLWLHVPAVLVSAGLAVTGLDCPLDTLEKWLRRRGGQTPYRGGFIAHYLVEPIHGTGIDGTLHLALRVLAVGVVVAAYAGLAFLHRRDWRRSAILVD